MRQALFPPFPQEVRNKRDKFTFCFLPKPQNYKSIEQSPCMRFTIIRMYTTSEYTALNGEDSHSSRCANLRLHLFSYKVEHADFGRDPPKSHLERRAFIRIHRDFRRLSFAQFSATSVLYEFTVVLLTYCAFATKREVPKNASSKKREASSSLRSKSSASKTPHARRRITNHEKKNMQTISNYAIMQIPWKDTKGIKSGKCILFEFKSENDLKKSVLVPTSTTSCQLSNEYSVFELSL